MMNTTKEPSPFARLWGWAADYHSGFYGAVALAVLGVACNMLAYFCIAAMIRRLLSGGGLEGCLPWCGLLLAAYAGKSIFSTWSTAVSHTATYHTLRDLRKSLLSKLSRVPMGIILDTPSGQYKTTIVDRVEGMEPTLAHLLPEMTANALVPLFLAVYIFVLDWRMGLASLVTTVIGLITASQSGKTYAVRWQGAVEVGRRMANAIVEYIGGIQVVKAFSQSAGSYRKYSKAVEDNAQYYVDWMAGISSSGEPTRNCWASRDCTQDSLGNAKRPPTGSWLNCRGGPQMTAVLLNFSVRWNKKAKW